MTYVRDLPYFPQDIPAEQRSSFTPDEIDEQHYNAEKSRRSTGGVTIKPFTGRNDPPLRVMERQHLPLGHPDRIPYEERMYQFFRNYRIDVERGRIACSDEEYSCVLRHEEIYKSFWLGSTEIDDWDISQAYKVPITRKNWGYVWRYYVSEDEDTREIARLTLLKDRRRRSYTYSPINIPEKYAEYAKALGMTPPYDEKGYAEYLENVQKSWDEAHKSGQWTVEYYGRAKSC